MLSIKKAVKHLAFQKKGVPLHSQKRVNPFLMVSTSQKLIVRGVAQPGLEYASGGRVVASSNLVTPTTQKVSNQLIANLLFFILLC